MPRSSRVKSPTGYYHIINRGINKQEIFKENREKSRMLNLILENQEEYNVKVYAYCIMSNHFHLLVKAELKELSSFMAKILANYAHYYNYKHKRCGYVFQNRYRSQCITDEQYFWSCLRYIHMNPVRAGLCKTIDSYRHSSAQEYCKTKTGNKRILSEEAVTMINLRFANMKEFIEFHLVNGKEFFIDMQEDELEQQIKLAKDILWNLQYELELSAEEILDYVKTRNMFENQIKEQLGISFKTAKEIREILRDKKGQG